MIEAIDLTVGYDTAAGRVRAVDRVSLVIHRGETLGLVGESGCGKSSLGRALLKLLPIEKGTVRFDGQDLYRLGGSALKKLRPRLQPVFQDPVASLDPRMTVGDTLAEALSVRGAATKERIEALLTTIGLPPDSGSRKPHGFSAGQRQRISIARALAVDPEFLVLDEPVSALDVSVQAQIVNLLVELQKKRKLTYLFISHDLGVVAHVSTRVAVMYAGRIVELGPTEAVLTTPRHPYTRALIASLPGGARVPIGGEPPSPLRRPPGCAFHPRCSFAVDACRSDVPLLETVGEGHVAACPVTAQQRGQASFLRNRSSRNF